MTADLAALARAREGLREALRMMLRNDPTFGVTRTPVAVVVPDPANGVWRVIRSTGAQVAVCDFQADAEAVASALALAPELLQ